MIGVAAGFVVAVAAAVVAAGAAAVAGDVIFAGGGDVVCMPELGLEEEPVAEGAPRAGLSVNLGMRSNLSNLGTGTGAVLPAARGRSWWMVD